jgi:hypothetical protein
MNGHRRAAVALYGLAPCDQERILAELPAPDQRILQEYLAELAALGFDKAANMADAVGPVPIVPVASPSDPKNCLHGAAATDVYAVIGHEPASLIAQVLALDGWPWAESFLDLLQVQKRKLVRDALDAGIAAAPARAGFLLAAVGAGLAQAPSAAPAERGRRAPVALLKWLPWTR